MINLLVIAGEHSGDNHAAYFVRQLKERYPEIFICAVGGPALKKAGAELIFDLTQWSVVGLAETLKHYQKFRTLMDWIVEWVRIYKPKTICLVDFPGFNLRLAKRLYLEGLSFKGGGETCICQYISPQIWAWKAKRRFDMENYIDHLGTIFMFEKGYFKDTTLDVQFVGHPLLHTHNPFHYDAQGPILLLPGSRKSAVQKIFPLLHKAFVELKTLHPELTAIVPCPNKNIAHYLRNFACDDLQVCLLSDLKQGVRCAITSSGTASLQVALAGIPGVITYKANPLTFWLGKRLVKIPYLGMANILLNRNLYPECLQDLPYQASSIALHMEAILSSQKDSREKFVEGAKQLHQLLSNQQLQNVTDWIGKYCI